MQLQRQLESTPHEPKLDEQKDSTTGGSSTKRRANKAPDSQALLAELLKLKTGLNENESRANHYSDRILLDKTKLERRRTDNQDLVDSLNDTSAATINTLGDTASRKPVDSESQPAQPISNVSELDSRLDKLEKKIGVGIEDGNAVREPSFIHFTSGLPPRTKALVTHFVSLSS